MNRRIDDERFTGASVVYALLCVCSFITGVVFSPILIDALQAVLQ